MLARRTLIQALLAATLVVGLAGLSTFAHWYKAWMDDFGPGWHATAWAVVPVTAGNSCRGFTTRTSSQRFGG